ARRRGSRGPRWPPAPLRPRPAQRARARARLSSNPPERSLPKTRMRGEPTPRQGSTMRALTSLAVRHGSEGAKETVVFIARAGREEEGGRGPGSRSVAERERPQTVDRNRFTVRRAERPQARGVATFIVGLACVDLECVDPAVAEVADQQATAEPPKRRRGD